jgi:hypothetical protein
MTTYRIEFVKQQYVDLPDGKTIGIHVFKPASTSNTFTVPKLASSTSGYSVKQLAKYGQTVLGTVPANSDEYTVAVTLTAAELAAAANDEIVVVSLHETDRQNYIPEEA